jgi:large subunit ribosomal protein L7/L12
VIASVVSVPMAFEVVLVDAGARVIEVVRHVRELTGGGISEAKQLVEQTPRVLVRTVDRGVAEELRRRLEVSGATVEITESPIGN